MFYLSRNIYIRQIKSEHCDPIPSIVGYRREDFPRLSVGAVIRIHDMETQPYEGESTGRVWNPAKITVIEGGVGKPINPLNADQWDDNFRFTDDDVKKVEELRLWWASWSSARSSGAAAGPPPATPAAAASQSFSQAEVPKGPDVPEAEAEAQPGSATPPASPPSSQAVTIPEPLSSSPGVTVPEPEASEETEVDPNEVTIPEENPVPVRRSKRPRKQSE